MNCRALVSWSRQGVLTCLLAAGLPPLAGATAPALVEAFQKGPITLTAKVIRTTPGAQDEVLPLFQVPVLKYQDKLELAFAGEAFDQRVTRADWSLVVVFLPRTVAPTNQGVVDFRLKRKGDHMEVPVMTAPYDSVPMIFLIPDKSGRKKVLKDLNAHLEAFRSLCAKISELSGERATLDKFLEDLEAIDKNLAPAQYDSALLGFLNTYGNGVSSDLQAFLNGPKSNLTKFQFVTQQFRKTNVLVPEAAVSAPAQVTVSAGAGKASAYVSIFFDVAAIVQNLWTGHQFQYLPALARNFHDSSADLYYNDWIHTTGDPLGALMCCPGKWEDQPAPAFEVLFTGGETLLKKQALLQVRPKENARKPFALYGHDWKLVLTGPKGESLPPLALTTSPGKDAFVAMPSSLLEPLRLAGAAKVQARVVGRWGFTSLTTEPVEVPTSCDPLWRPTAEEVAGFQLGQGCALKLPAPWAVVVEAVTFRPATGKALTAALKPLEDGAREAVFTPRGDTGPGTLELRVFGNPKPALTLPLTLRPAPPQATGFTARHGETGVALHGHHLEAVQSLLLGDRRFLPADASAEAQRVDAETRWFKAEDGKPLEGPVGRKLEGALVLAGAQVALAPGTVLPARPRLADVQVLPMAVKGAGLGLTSTLPVAASNAPSQVNLLTGALYRLPPDRAFHIAVRNADEPAEVRPIAAAKVRIMGNSQKASFTLMPLELLGGRAAGRLEVQLVDDHAGASDWLPLPATFVDLPVITAVQASPAGLQLIGPSLDPVQEVAPSPTGPWEKVKVVIEEGRETVSVTTPLPASRCYLRLFGWPELVLALNVPVPVKIPAIN